MHALFRKTGVLMIDSLLKEAAFLPVQRNQAQNAMSLRDLNQRPGAKGDVMSQGMLAKNPSYQKGLEAAYNDHLGGLGSTAVERAPKVISVAK